MQDDHSLSDFTAPPLSTSASSQASSLANRVLQNSAIVFFGQSLSLVARLLATILMARYLGQEGFGVFSYGLVFVGFFSLIADFGMKPILVRELSRDKWPAAQIMGNTVFIKTILSLLSVSLSILVAWLMGFTAEYFLVIMILSFNILVSFKMSTFRVVFESPFQANLQMKFPILFQLIDSLLLLGLIYYMSKQSYGLVALVAAYVLANTPGFLLTVSWALRKSRFRIQFDKGLVIFLVKKSLPIWAYTILVTIFGGADILLLRSVWGEAAVGLYSAAFRLTIPLLFIPSALIVSVFPLLSRYYEGREEWFSKVFDLGLKIILAMGLALALGAMFLADQVIVFLYSKEYSASINALKILMWAEVFVFLNFYLLEVMVSRNLQRVNLYAAIIMVTVNLILIFILIPKYGIEGASFAKLAAAASSSSFMFLAMAKQVRVKLAYFFFQFLLFAALLSLWFWLSSHFHLAVAAVLSIFVFGLLLFLSGIFSKEEKRTIISLVKTYFSRNRPLQAD